MSERPRESAEDVNPERTYRWLEVIKAVKSPLSLLVLVVLVTEATLSAVAWRTDSEAVQLALGIAMATILVVVIVAVLVKPTVFGALSPVAREILPLSVRYDAFVSAPMAALADQEAFERQRADTLKVIDAMRRYCGCRDIFYAGSEISRPDQFESEDVAARMNMNALRDSRIFVLIYPEKQASSVLVEAGIALALRKPSLLFVRSRDDLPYLLRRIGQAREDGDSLLPQVRIYDAPDADAIVNLFKTNKKALLPARLSSRT